MPLPEPRIVDMPRPGPPMVGMLLRICIMDMPLPGHPIIDY